jgi:hypothetical protein
MPTAHVARARAQAAAGVALVALDTSPRGAGAPGEDEAYDLGTGAGFYVDATREPWRSAGYRRAPVPVPAGGCCQNSIRLLDSVVSALVDRGDRWVMYIHG